MLLVTLFFRKKIDLKHSQGPTLVESHYPTPIQGAHASIDHSVLLVSRVSKWHLMKRNRYQTDRNLIMMDPGTNFLTGDTWPEAENAIGFGSEDSVCCFECYR